VSPRDTVRIEWIGAGLWVLGRTIEERAPRGRFFQGERKKGKAEALPERNWCEMPRTGRFFRDVSRKEGGIGEKERRKR